MPEPVISADSHVFEPGDLWLERVDPRYRDRVPRFLRDESGEDRVYTARGETVPATVMFVGMGSAGERGRTSITLDEVRRGGFDPVARLQDQDVDGVKAEVLYPSFGMQLFAMEDPELQVACMRAYNDWLADYC